MTFNRWKEYGSFFSNKIVKTTNVVSQLVVTSTAVTQLKDGLDKCINVGEKSLENARIKIEEIAHSDDVKNFSTSVQKNYDLCQQAVREGYDQATSAAKKYIGQENIEKISQQWPDYNKSISENYEFAQHKVDEFLKSEEIVRLKSIVDNSMDSIVSANLLFDFGLLLVPGSGPLHMTLKCSKYLAAATIFLLSSIKSYQVKEQDGNFHEKMDHYQQHINEAYHVMSELNILFLNMEEQLKKLNLHEFSLVGPKDFEVKKPSLKFSNKTPIDKEIFLKSILEGIEKSSGLFYLLHVVFKYLPKKNFFIFLKIINFLIILIAMILSSLQKNILKTNHEKQFHALQEKLGPIFSTMNKLYAKLSKGLSYEDTIPVNHEDQEIDLSDHLKTLSEVTSKASGLHLLLKEIFSGDNNSNFILSFFIMLISNVNSYTETKKQDEIKHSLNDFEFKMESLIEMTDKMKTLLNDQKEYAVYLKELNQLKTQLLKKQGIFNEKPLLLEAEDRPLDIQPMKMV